MRRLCCLLICLGFAFTAPVVSAQSGHYFLSHHTPSIERIDYLSFDIAQSQSGIIYFANKAGVVEFDGSNWNVIETQGAIYTLAITENNELYAGGLSGYGKLALNEENVMSFFPLSGKEARNIFSSKVLNDKIYFLNESSLFEVAMDGTQATIENPGQETFSGMAVIAGDLYLTAGEGNLLKLQDGKLVNASFDFLAGDELLFSSGFGDRFLIGTTSGRVFVYAGGKASEIILADKDYLQNNVLANGLWVNDQLIALGTLGGGILFANPATGATEEITNYNTGLPDNEVFAMMKDRNQGVWVAHDYGFTRIAPFVPLRTFNHYPGLSGNLLSAYTFNNQVYVGTSVGLYLLQREEVYEEQIYYVAKAQQGKAVVEQIETKGKVEKSRKGLFGFLKRNKKQEGQGSAAVKGNGQPTPGRKPGAAVEKRTRKILLGLQYVYKKVEGINGKVTQLAEVNSNLMAAGVAGVFHVEGLKSKALMGSPVRSFFFSHSLKQLLVSTYEGNVHTLQYKGNNWVETHLLDTLKQYVTNIFEDNIDNIWLCGRAEVVKVELIEGAIIATSSVPFASLVADESLGFSLGSEVFVAASGAFHRYDAIAHQFIKYDSLPDPRKYFASSGTFWFNDGHRWRTTDAKLQATLKLEWLRLFQDIRTLAPIGEGKDLWLITSDNELYKFRSPDNSQVTANYPLILKSIRGSGKRLAPMQRINVSELESALSFEFVQPEYTSYQGIEYQYLIEGITKNWTDWSPANNTISFPYLSPGRYKLEVKSRDILGNISALQPIDFIVEPPYWKETWFYAVEFIFFGMLVLLSIKLSAANARYRRISQLLSILTVIMFIQLMQNAAESFLVVQTTPVAGFFIQVFIALLILPVESKMRNFMAKAGEGKYKLEQKNVE